MSVFDPFEYEYETYPLIRTNQQVDKLQKGQVLKVLANDPVALQNIDAWAKKSGNELLEVEVI